MFPVLLSSNSAGLSSSVYFNTCRGITRQAARIHSHIHSSAAGAAFHCFAFLGAYRAAALLFDQHGSAADPGSCPRASRNTAARLIASCGTVRPKSHLYVPRTMPAVTHTGKDDSGSRNLVDRPRNRRDGLPMVRTEKLFGQHAVSGVLSPQMQSSAQPYRPMPAARCRRQNSTDCAGPGSES